MIRLQVSRRALRAVVACILVPAAIAGLYGVGLLVTPLDAGGHPLVLSPSLRAAEMYRGQARDWAGQMAELDDGLTALLAGGEPADAVGLYEQGQEMQVLGERAVALANDVDTSEVPVALLGLREQAQVAADAYVEASVATARWLNAPSEAGRREALEALRTARAQRLALEESRWLATN